MPGAARLVLADGVVHLDPEPAVLEAMLDGWALQQRTRFLRESTINPRIALVRRLARFTNEYPWQWDPAEVEAFFDDLRTRRPGRPLAVSTARNYQNDLRLFFDARLVLAQRDQCQERWQLDQTASTTPWLFPGQEPARPLGATYLNLKLRRHGIAPLAGRNNARLALATDLPASVLADLTGTSNATRWTVYARRDWLDYIASRASGS